MKLFDNEIETNIETKPNANKSISYVGISSFSDVVIGISSDIISRTGR